MSTPAAEIERNRALAEGRARGGVVSLRDFDQGVVETLGATIIHDNYWLQVEGIDPPPGSPGVPVTFSYPEDVYEKYKLPVLMVRRDDISPAMQRWHPGTLQYRAPAVEGLPAATQLHGVTVTGSDRYEEQQQAVPFDLMYSLQISARYRGALRSRNHLNRLLDFVLRVYPPYCLVVVKDSIQSIRTYEAFMEGISPMDDVADVADRTLGFTITLRVEGELDLHDPVVYRAVTQPAVVRSRHMR